MAIQAAIYPGTFDPITKGHTALIERAAALFGRVIIAIPTASVKTPCFTLAERITLVTDVLAHLGQAIEVITFDKTLVEFAAEQKINTIVRGLRDADDFSYEARMAAMNRTMTPEIDTVFLASTPALSPISASLVREIAAAGGKIDAFVADVVRDALHAKYFNA